MHLIYEFVLDGKDEVGVESSLRSDLWSMMLCIDIGTTELNQIGACMRSTWGPCLTACYHVSQNWGTKDTFERLLRLIPCKNLLEC